MSDVPHNREGQSNERALSLNVFVLFLSVIVLFSQHKEFGIWSSSSCGYKIVRNKVFHSTCTLQGYNISDVTHLNRIKKITLKHFLLRYFSIGLSFSFAEKHWQHPQWVSSDQCWWGNNYTLSDHTALLHCSPSSTATSHLQHHISIKCC